MRGRVFFGIIACLLGVWLPAQAGESCSAVMAELVANLERQDKLPWSQGSSRIVGEVALLPPPKKSIDWSTTVPLLIAILSIAGAYWNGTRLEARKAKIAFVNEQIKSLYGPLFSLNGASLAAWKSFRSECRPSGAFFSATNPPTEPELREWIIWMKTVFQPMNEKISRTIVDNAHLIDGDTPSSFLDFISHVEGYRVVIRKWEDGDYSKYTSSINFPDDFRHNVTDAFDRVKARQASLLR